MSRTNVAERERTERRAMRLITTGAIALAVVLAGVFVSYVTTPSEGEDVYDASLPNPMGGPARTAPGEATGQVELDGLTIDGAELDMGEVGLGVTYVPSWQVANPTDRVVFLAVGQPAVLEGCCPGPIYVDGEMTQVDEWVSVPPGGTTQVQFPLQMHPGMDGPHHLVVPVSTEGGEAALHVSGDFTADAQA